MPSRRALTAGLVCLACLCLLAAAAAEETASSAPRSGDLPAFAPGFETPIEGALALAVDARDHVWVLTREPDAFVRLDERGAVAERVPFAWPDGVSGAVTGDLLFVITGSGDFLLGRTRFDRGGQRITTLDSNQAWDMAAGPGGTAVLLTYSGLEVFDRRGRRLRRFSEGGIAPGKIDNPQALIVDERGRSIVADRFRLQVFGRHGRFVRAVELPAELRGDITRIDGLARDGDGVLYVRLVNHPVEVAVFDRELRYLGALHFLKPWPSSNLVADRQGRLYSLAGKIVRQAAPVAGSVRGARPLPGTPVQEARAALPVRAAPATPVRALLADSPPRPYRVHASTRDVLDVAADPLVPGRLWLATTGGLVRYEPATESWRKWTVADGLPEPEVRSVLSDGRRVFLLLKSGAAVFDVEAGTFQSLQLSSEGALTGLGSGRIVSDPTRPGLAWWIVTHGVLRHDLEAGTWSFFRSPAPVRDGLVLPGPEARPILLTENEIWELRPGAGTWRLLWDVDDLGRAAPDRHRPADKLTPRSLSASPDGRSLWVGTWSADLLLHLDLQSGAVSWPAWARDLRCSSSRVVHHRGRIFLAGSDCFREIGEGCCCEIDPEESGEVRRTLADPRLPGLLWLATDQGLASFRLEDARFSRHRSLEPEPHGTWASSIFPAEGRLWVAFNNAALSVLDPASGRWTIFSDLQSVRLVRGSAVNPLLLVHGTFRQGMPELAWFDPRTVEQGSMHATWRSLWSSLDDFHLDEQGLWGTGPLEGKGTKGFALLRPDGTRQIWIEGSGAPHRFVADSRHPGSFWMRTVAGDLVRFRPEMVTPELVRRSIYDLRFTGDRWLWGLGWPNIRQDLETGTLAELRLTGKIFPDPDDPQRAWSLERNRFQLCDLSTGELIADLPLPAGSLPESPVRLGGRLWLATTFGLLEVPLDSLPAPAGASPPKCLAWRNHEP